MISRVVRLLVGAGTDEPGADISKGVTFAIWDVWSFGSPHRIRAKRGKPAGFGILLDLAG
jgi:hypothetical protein